MKRSTNRILAALLAVLFGVFLLKGTSMGSDFPRGLYGSPDTVTAHWDSMALLKANRLWNYNLNGDPSLQNYLNNAYSHGMKAVLTPPGTFYLSYYSCGRHHLYQAEQHYNAALYKMGHDDPLGFYFFHHASAWNGTVRGELAPDVPAGGASWKCSKGAFYGRGIMLNGPNETLEGEKDEGTWASHLAWPDEKQDRHFKSIIRVMANLDGLAPNDTVFSWRIYKLSGNVTLNSAYYTAASFGRVSAPQWKQFELEYTIPAGGFNLMYAVDWKNKCDFWVDWVEFYDMRRGRYLFEQDESGQYVYRSATLAQIADQCRAIENSDSNGEKIAGWKQSDEPIRSSFDAHGVVNLMARESLSFPPVTPFAQLTNADGGSSCWFLRRPELFVLLGRPPILDADIYPYLGWNSIGNQVELDTLADRLERCYKAVANSSIPFQYTAQAHSWYKNSWTLRDPLPPEIYAETYMALAHGAKGITFYKYTTNQPGSSMGYGLVNTSYEHPYGQSNHYYGEKWEAVRLVFSQLDSIGGTLLGLKRRAAFCARDGGYLPPLQQIYFEEEPGSANAYIEVGQFTDALTETQAYLILVNRRTDADRHVTVKTNLAGQHTLRDLYTQERFVSRDEEIRGIPFKAGEGRVFKLEAE